MEWFDRIPIWLVGVVLVVALTAAAMIGYATRKRLRAGSDGADGEGGAEGYIISAVLGLLALLLGFTFSLAVERFETRRALVLQEANAIGTSYLRSQALAEPHRSRMSAILVAYTDNRVLLGTAKGDRQKALLAKSDGLLDQLWAATLAAYDSVQSKPFAVSLLSTVNEVIDMDSSRKAGRRVRIPGEVLLVLAIYLVITAGILGSAQAKKGGRPLTGMLLVLLTMSYMLIIDIDRPNGGGITEGQGPMIDLQQTLKHQAPGTFDRWRSPAASAMAAPSNPQGVSP